MWENNWKTVSTLRRFLPSGYSKHDFAKYAIKNS